MPVLDDDHVKVEINKDTLEVRVYADSAEALESVACRFCAKTAQCDHQVIKPCYIPCG